MKISFIEHLSKLPLAATEKWPEGVWDIEAFKHGSMSLVLFAPEGDDYQTPHSQDELYFVLEGSGTLEREGVRIPFKKGDALFVKAGEQHRFSQFEKGLKMWAVFWGDEGGETNG